MTAFRQHYELWSAAIDERKDRPIDKEEGRAGKVGENLILAARESGDWR